MMKVIKHMALILFLGLTLALTGVAQPSNLYQRGKDRERPKEEDKKKEQPKPDKDKPKDDKKDRKKPDEF